ncbi:MAG: AAA family ATPase, partial [Oscillospiraceae bacterium]
IERIKRFDDPLKKQALQNIFTDSQIALIYGAAGTGKTNLINYISNLMNNKRKLFLTKTHTTLQNLKRRIENPGVDADFVSIDRFTKKVILENYDIIFVDECSIIDNDTMLKFMNKISEDTFVVLAGDVFQIESINFGNWFFYAKDIIKTNGANIELINTWRTEDETLKDLWNEVRTKAPLITEKLAIDGDFSEDIGPNIFNKSDDEEVVLCLNYDGKFGLNNMNQYFQNDNKNGEFVTWKEWGYKIGDPIIFNDTKRFELLYNNLKGRIVDIAKTAEYIMFTVDINILLTEADCRSEEIEFIDIIDDTTRISFKVFAFDDSAEESEIDKMLTVIPFQIAYAISIHKAQGLEFNSVKVIIPSSNSEKITHDIFYTAITRAKKKLKIFWSSETMKMIIEEFSKEGDKDKSLNIIKSKI